MNILISAGDTSGDIHAANLVKALKKAGQDISVTALGGEELKASCDKFLYNLVELSGFGFWQPLKLYFKLKRVLLDIIIRYYNDYRPDKVIVVDYYGFNIHVAKEAFKKGIPVYYYISPQVWATRPGRIKKIAKYVKKMLVILPFEEKLYKDAGVDAVFVGNPLIDIVPEPDGIPKDTSAKPVIGLFPGSRRNVFKHHIGLLLETANMLKERVNADFKIFCVPALAGDCSGLPYPAVIENDFSERKKLAFAITTSGTVNLENALLGIPMLVYYRLTYFNYFIAKMLIRIPYIAMVNILLGKMLVPELIQSEAVPEMLSAKAAEILKSGPALTEYRNSLLGLRAMLGKPGVSVRAAEIILRA